MTRFIIATCALHCMLERAAPRRSTFPFPLFRRTDWELPSELCEASHSSEESA